MYFATSFFIFSYFYQTDFVLLKATLTFSILKQIPLVKMFSMDPKNVLAYNQQHIHHWCMVGAWLFFICALHAFWSRLTLRGGGRSRLRSSLPPCCHIQHLSSCPTAWWSLLLRIELCSRLFSVDGMLGIFSFGTDYGYLKASMQAVTCNSVGITLSKQRYCLLLVINRYIGNNRRRDFFQKVASNFPVTGSLENSRVRGSMVLYNQTGLVERGQ